MKRIITIVLFSFLSSLCFSQNNQSGKLLNQADREKCSIDVEFLYQMAQKEYPEAEYLFARILQYFDPYDAENKKYWVKFDENDSCVAAAYYLKKACEHGWNEAFDLYAEYCYYGRGGVTGGLNEAIRWQEKAYESDSSDWTYAANLGLLYLSDDTQSNDELGVELLNLVITMPQVESDFYVFLGRACFYGIGVQQNLRFALICFYHAVEAPESKFDFNSKNIALYYLAYCFNNGIGDEKDEEYASLCLQTINKEPTPTMADCEQIIQKYNIEYSKKRL